MSADTANVDGCVAPGWVTVTVAVAVPSVVVIVTLPVRVAVDVLGCTHKVRGPLFEPLLGVVVNQVASDDFADHVVFE